VAVKQHLPSLGRLIGINGLWTIYKPLSYFDPLTDWRRLDSTGPIFINLIHEIDLLHYWYGPITRAYAEQTVSQRGFDTEEGAAISGNGENPIIPRTGQDFHRAFGSEGSLSVPDMTLWEYGECENNWT